jgi:hypothetical protein
VSILQITRIRLPRFGVQTRLVKILAPTRILHFPLIVADHIFTFFIDMAAEKHIWAVVRRGWSPVSETPRIISKHDFEALKRNASLERFCIGEYMADSQEVCLDVWCVVSAR